MSETVVRNGMLKMSRLQAMKGILEAEGEIQITELSRRFQVSEMTVRRDLDDLAKEAAIIRTRGGAYLAPPSQRQEPNYSYRQRKAGNFKEKIAAKAAEMMREENNIYIDSGTSTEWILRHVSDRHYIIVTNGINIAQEAVNHSRISTVLIGGDFRSNTLSTTGAAAEAQIAEFRYDIAFLGCNAIDAQGTVYVGTTLEVGVKKLVIEKSARCYVLADSSKFNGYSLAGYGNLKELDGVITDDGISADTVKQLETLGVRVIIAE